MTRSPTAGRRLAHFWLLVAALLQFGAATVGPWAHLAAADLGAGPAWLARSADAGSGPLHDEAGCALCHTLAAVALLPAESTAPLFPQSAEARLPEPASPGRSPSVGLPSARSPPLA